jgi:hypothetical protein
VTKKMCSNDTKSSSSQNEFEREFPGMELVNACYALTCPEDSPCPPDNEFFMLVKFKTDYPSKKSWQSFRNFVQSLRESGRAVDNTKDVWVRIEVVMSVFSELYFRIHGHNILLNEDLDGISADDPTCPIAGSEPA